MGLGAIAAAAAVTAAGQGLPLGPDNGAGAWPGTSTSNAFAGLSLARAHAGVSLHLFSDYYFYDAARGSLGPTLGGILGGFRASTGAAGQPVPLSLFDNLPESNQSLPYLGLGYSQLWLNNSLRLNADMGLATQNPWASAHLHSQANGTPSLDDLTRDVRWAPVMSVSLGFSF
ncbi:MAG TPA: hypothetical protein VH328_07730 [Burkholderiaceae bacterium]|nr:hypothetical protein [Burkholderiaceae bacterium]